MSSPVPLKCAITNDDQRAERWVGQLRADRRGHGKSHRCVVGRPEKLRAPMDEKVCRAEERIAHVDDDNGFMAEKSVQPLKEALYRQLGTRFHAETLALLRDGDGCWNRAGGAHR